MPTSDHIGIRSRFAALHDYHCVIVDENPSFLLFYCVPVFTILFFFFFLHFISSAKWCSAEKKCAKHTPNARKIEKSVSRPFNKFSCFVSFITSNKRNLRGNQIFIRLCIPAAAKSIPFTQLTKNKYEWVHIVDVAGSLDDLTLNGCARRTHEPLRAWVSFLVANSYHIAAAGAGAAASDTAQRKRNICDSTIPLERSLRFEFVCFH